MSGHSISHIHTREGLRVPFDPARIERAISQAALAVGEPDLQVAGALTVQVVERLEREYAGREPGVEDIRDMVEGTLMAGGHQAMAREYADTHTAKRFLGVTNDLKLPLNALAVLKRRYLSRDDQGEIKETPGQMFRRVARFIAREEEKYGGDAGAAEELFYQVMASRRFLPNSPTLMNAGTRLGLLSACFVLPVPDSIPEIFESVKNMAIIHQAGGGTGFSFSQLRPRGDRVGSTMGIASGPVSFMGAFDGATEVVKQGGRRRGANMGVLRVDHPDIMDFIGAKQREGVLTNFNLSVAATDSFMEAARNGGEYSLVNPRTGGTTGSLRADAVMQAIASAAWQCGDPGMIFLDRINRDNPTPGLGAMETTNPCGEQPLLPYESCNLGSIDLSRLVSGKDIDWQQLGQLVDTGVRLLDDVIDANRFPLKEIERMTLGNRKIGLGVMGLAQAFIRLGIRYDSQEALDKAEAIMAFISERAVACSRRLGRERGSFPNFPESTWKQRGFDAMRNATLTTIAPTGSISVIAGTTSGIEPLFAISYVRDVMDGVHLLETNADFQRIAAEKGFLTEDLMNRIAHSGSIRHLEQIPREVRELFVTALDIEPQWHIRMQAAFQKHVDNAVSKTVNMSRDAGIDQVRHAFMLAWELGCKGVTVFRYGSRSEQVLYFSGEERDSVNSHVRADAEFSGGCPAVDCEI